MLFAYAGLPPDPRAKRLLAKITGVKNVKVRRYQSLSQMVNNDHGRPAFDLVVVSSEAETSNMWMGLASRFIDTKGFICIINGGEDAVSISDKIARVSLSKQPDFDAIVALFIEKASSPYAADWDWRITAGIDEKPRKPRQRYQYW